MSCRRSWLTPNFRTRSISPELCARQGARRRTDATAHLSNIISGRTHFDGESCAITQMTRPICCSVQRRSFRGSFLVNMKCPAICRLTLSSSSACRVPARPWLSKFLLESFGSRRHNGVARYSFNCAASWRKTRKSTCVGLSRNTRQAFNFRASGSRRQYLERASIYRRQGRPFFVDKMPNNFQHIGTDPPHSSEREDHRRKTTSARLLLFEFQAALRARPELRLRSDRPWAVLQGLCRADGAFRRRLARKNSSGDLRGHGQDPTGSPPSGLLRPAVRASVPAFLS